MKIIKIIFLASIILILNLIWEFLHYQLYIDMSGISTFPHLFLASFTDVFILLVIFSLISLAHKSIKWINHPSKLDYFVLFALAISTSATIEIINLNLGRWAYTELMPTIFRIGISPLFQLAVTGILAILIIKILNKNTK